MSTGGATELIENLKRLSEVDEQLAMLDNKKAALEEEIRSLEASIVQREREISEKLNKIKEESHQEHRGEVLLREINQELQKAQAQLNTARTNEELRTFKKKCEKFESRIAEIEDAILLHLTEVDKSGEEVEASRKVQQSRDEEARLKISKLRDEIAKCEQERSTFSEKRKNVASQVPHDVLNKYERVLAREKHRPVVAVRNNTCQGCFMRVTFQQINRIWQGNDLVLCRNCSRILYLPEDEKKG